MRKAARSRKLASSTLIALGVALAPAAAAAQALPTQEGFALDRFDPADRGSDWFVADSLDLRGHKRFAAGGVIGAWAYNPLVVYDRDGNYQSSLVEHQIFVHPGVSGVFWNRVRAGLSLPIAVYQTGDDAVARNKLYRAPEAPAAGDVRLTSDVRLFGTYGGLVTGALGGAIYFPTGSRDNYTSDGTFRFTPRATVAGDVAFFTYSARLGLAVRPLTERFERNPLGSEVAFSAAAGVRALDKRLVVGPELYGSSIIDQRSFFRRRGTPIEWLIGAHYTISDFRLGGGLGTGLTRGWGTPALRAFLSAEWTPGLATDTDEDGIPDKEDACPTTRGPRTRDARTNGCPPAPPPVVPPAPEADRDGDGIADRVDACPDQPGPASDVAKKNGCPPDRDNDGVPDLADACADVPGPTSPDPAKNGCPPDRDNDGIADEKDACPDLAGEASADPLNNGCPPDRDGDGVYDKEDACPDAPGPGDPDPKRNGCPLARIEGGQIKIVEQVKFKTNSADLLRDSDMTLVAVATMLKSHPEITKLRIEGHTDNRGKDERNKQLSYERAVAVQKWLVASGLDKNRFEAKGYGNARPIDNNATEEGRSNNRRVEFHIVTKSP